MTVATSFISWSRPDLRPGPPYSKCSPNLDLIREWMAETWGMFSVGCYNVRPIRGGTAWSAHAYGAALDMSYRKGPARTVIVQSVIPALVDHSLELGIQAVHDYFGERYWRAGQGWINRRPGAPNDHLHVEVHPWGWPLTTPIANRFHQVPAGPPPYPGTPTAAGSRAKARITMIQQRLNAWSSAVKLKVDGQFGPRTKLAVQEFQRANGLTADGIVGPKTWAALFDR